jgi:hypothetical protein
MRTRKLDDHDATEPLIAYVYGNTPPDFAPIAAAGFEVVCLDSLAPWFSDVTIGAAATHGLRAVGFPMSWSPADKARQQLRHGVQVVDVIGR